MELFLKYLGPFDNNIKAIKASKGKTTTCKDPMIYVNTALNDLIGSYMQKNRNGCNISKKELTQR